MQMNWIFSLCVYNYQVLRNNDSYTKLFIDKTGGNMADNVDLVKWVLEFIITGPIYVWKHSWVEKLRRAVNWIYNEMNSVEDYKKIYKVCSEICVNNNCHKSFPMGQILRVSNTFSYHKLFYIPKNQCKIKNICSHHSNTLWTKQMLTHKYNNSSNLISDISYLMNKSNNY